MTTRILVLYGTTDGHTARIARRLGETLARCGALCDVVDAASRQPTPVGYDGVIVAASVHASGYQRAVRRWVRTHAASLADKPCAFLSVCLGVLQKEPEVQREVVATMTRFFAAVGWEPLLFKAVPGALLYTKYGWLKRAVMRRIVRKAGGELDTSRDYEYTDWAEIDRFAETFAGQVDRVAVGLSAAPCQTEPASPPPTQTSLPAV